MTVCVAVKVHDCIVFSADSAATLTGRRNDGNPEILNVYNNADKVFNLHRDLPLVAMTCGMGHISGESISSLAKEFRHGLMKGEHPLNSEDYTVQEVVDRAQNFLQKKYEQSADEASPDHYLEFWIGGYGSDNKHGEIWRLVLAEGSFGAPEQLNREDDPQGVFWGGQGQAISRLMMAIDPGFVEVITEEGIDREVAASIYNRASQKLRMPLFHATMPTIDAIRLSEFLVDVTKGYHSFAYGSDIVGGATDTATVTKWEGFKWIKRKHFYPAELNQRGSDHAT